MFALKAKEISIPIVKWSINTKQINMLINKSRSSINYSELGSSEIRNYLIEANAFLAARNIFFHILKLLPLFSRNGMVNINHYLESFGKSGYSSINILKEKVIGKWILLIENYFFALIGNVLNGILFTIMPNFDFRKTEEINFIVSSQSTKSASNINQYIGKSIKRIFAYTYIQTNVVVYVHENTSFKTTNEEIETNKKESLNINP